LRFGISSEKRKSFLSIKWVVATFDDKEELDAFCDASIIAEVCQKLKALGFNYVTLDLEGYRSGSMDEVYPPTNLARSDNL
jgi:hypothetical protein